MYIITTATVVDEYYEVEPDDRIILRQPLVPLHLLKKELEQQNINGELSENKSETSNSSSSDEEEEEVRNSDYESDESSNDNVSPLSLSISISIFNFNILLNIY